METKFEEFSENTELILMTYAEFLFCMTWITSLY